MITGGDIVCTSFEGAINKSDTIHMIGGESGGIALEVGCLKPDMFVTNTLHAGEIGYIVTNLKSTREARVGDTVTLAKIPPESLYRAIKK